MNTTAQCISAELKKMGNTQRAEVSQRFFKTGPGEYGEGDVFIGITVPNLRKLAKKYRAIPQKTIKQLLESPVHEERLFALLVLVLQYQNSSATDKARIYKLYISATRYINNWDLVDVTAPSIVGHFLSDRDRGPLYDFAKSPSLWERRIAVISTFFFIRQNEFKDTLAISKLLLGDGEDLIHKAVGWMLREVGKRDRTTEEAFLAAHYKTMPRTMLRYAIERFPETRRQQYLKGKI